MPKLGLTMTEGKVAHWNTAPGVRFQAGDVIVVVETDKIAYDVEAPAPGILYEVLAGEGTIVPVGAPIGRWDVGDAKVSIDSPSAETTTQQDAPVSAVSQPSSAPVETKSQREAARTLATPFARRLASVAGIDLGQIDGSGPRGRIKAADVNRAIEEARARKTPAVSTAAAPPTAVSASFTAGIEIDVTALLRLNKQINEELPQLNSELVHFVVLAAAKAPNIFFPATLFGLAPKVDDESGVVRLIASRECTTLRQTIALVESTTPAMSDSPLGALWIDRALDGMSFVSSAPPSGWSAAITIGSVRDTFRADADDRPMRAATMTLVLSGRPGQIDSAAAQRFLHRIRLLLEAPLVLLAS